MIVHIFYLRGRGDVSIDTKFIHTAEVKINKNDKGEIELSISEDTVIEKLIKVFGKRKKKHSYLTDSDGLIHY